MKLLDRAGLERVLGVLAERGYELVGPTERDGAIVLDRIDGLADLPVGVRDEQGWGSYRLTERGDERLFGYVHGPDSAKRFLFPGRELLGTVRRDEEDRLVFEAPDEEPPRYAILGLRACDLRAVEVQDRVFLGGPVDDASYAYRRRGAFLIGVDCDEPGGTCFCASMGTGPACTSGFDLALTEIEDGFLARAGSPVGEEVLEAVDPPEATDEQRAEGEARVRRARKRMGRVLATGDLPGLLYRNREHPRWADVAERCLACGNCTSVCPTCFCHDVVDGVNLSGTRATRTREWASCFSEEYSHIVGTEVRTSREARYRQWLTHKFASWIDQFDTSGCVGCGRCITWCPVGIDVTEEIAAIRASDGVREEAPV